jgi:hypothetical protein
MTRSRRTKAKIKVPDRPILPGSPLYRLLQAVALEVVRQQHRRNSGTTSRHHPIQPKQGR